MPVHDWTRVSDGVFHHFHHSWIVEIKRALRRGLLPEGYYVMIEQIGGDLRDRYARVQRTIVVRHTIGDRPVAMIEVLSRGNKSSRHAIRSFLDKTVAALNSGVHLLLVDVHPPGPRDPNGIHAAFLPNEIGAEERALGRKHPFTAVAYISGADLVDALVNYFAVGEAIPEMPLFLTQKNCVLVPLEAAYMAAWDDVPEQYQQALLASS